jgi:hypothetical protein
MYIDYHKYNYDLVDNAELEKYIQRDKVAYKKVLRQWIEENIDSITERKWEIEEIGHLNEVSDFIKLIKEGETLFELGFYTSCIALIGVSSEDFSKYLSLKIGRNNHIQNVDRQGRSFDLSQFDRLKLQLNESILTQDQYDLLDEIRKKRNDCLHYNQNFKIKDKNELKQDAIICLNNLKIILKDILGTSNQPNEKELLNILEEIAKGVGSDIKNKDEMRSKVRNVISHLFNFDVTFETNKKYEIKDDYFLIKEIDFKNNETTLAPVLKNPGLFVIVELNDKEKERFTKLNLKENDTIWATLYSKISDIGMTEEWYFVDLHREDNFSEVFHEIIENIINE